MNEGEDSTNLPNMYTTQVVVSGVDEMDLSDACMHRRLGLAERESFLCVAEKSAICFARSETCVAITTAGVRVLDRAIPPPPQKKTETLNLPFNKNLKTCKSPLPPTLHRGNPCQKHL